MEGVKVDSVWKGARKIFNFISGTNVTITAVDSPTPDPQNPDADYNEVEITINSTGGGVSDHGVLTGLADDDHTQYILKALLDAKGDLILASAADTPVRVAVGTNGFFLKADSTQAAGVAWSEDVDVPYAQQVDDDVAGTMYVGQAVPGTATSAASWRIKRVVTTGIDISTTWADGNSNFDNVWNDRAGLSYS